MIEQYSVLFLIILVFTFINCRPDTQNYDGKHLSSISLEPFPIYVESSTDQQSSKYWLNKGQSILKEQLLKTRNQNIAKNVIFFLGDGMSIATITAARKYYGQRHGTTGEEVQLSFEEFPYVGLSKTYCVNKQTADSACSATAYLCGVKANFGTIGVNANVGLNNCSAQLNADNHVTSIVKWAQRAGKKTGIVTTTRVTHASPAGTYAHVANREYECDADVVRYKQIPTVCQDIASQLVYNKPGVNFNVIMGGGRAKFITNDTVDEDNNAGERQDGVNLIDVWRKLKGKSGAYVHDKKGLLSLDTNHTEYVLGLFTSQHMSYNLEANRDKEPSLAEMVIQAIKLLEHNEKGFFLFVEGGRIDHAHHETKARKALDETVEFSEAIRKAVELVNINETLIVVTSDHAHTMTIAGYSDRNQDVLGFNTLTSDVDNHPYTTISYANGQNNGRLTKFVEADLKDGNFQYPSLVPMKNETHGGDDVAVFAIGPWSHLFSGAYEQNSIPHVIAYASCIGKGIIACTTESKQTNNVTDKI